MRDLRRALTAGDIAVGLALVLLLAFAPAALLAADAEPAMPDPSVPHADVRLSADAPRVRSLPAGLPDGMDVRTPEDLRPLATAALGATAATRLLALTTNQTPSLEDDLRWSLVWPGYDDIPQPDPPYPYRYRPLERLLGAAPPSFDEHAGALGAALVVLASRTVADGSGSEAAYPEAAPIAFAVLHRAAAEPDCDARLDLLLLLTADTMPREDPVRREFERAAAACPGDPTPSWLYAQYLSLRSQQREVPDLIGDAVPPDAVDMATAALEDALTATGSPDILAALADVEVREAERIADEQPFAARARLRTAVPLYRRASAARPEGPAEYDVGLARALLALGRSDQAAEVVRRDAAALRSGYALELQVSVEESARQFSRASATARTLADLGPSVYPAAGALFPMPAFGASFEGDDLDIPLVSVGVAGSAPLSVTLQPSEGGGGGFVEDLSFLPAYRDDPGWTGVLGQCPAWAWRRDAILAGDAAAAWADLPRDPEPSDPLERCRSGQTLDEAARATVAAEAGEEWEPPTTGQDVVFDRRQNLWRWAGDLDRAAAVIEEWREAAGEEAPLPLTRLAEVRFLQERYDEAAATFASAVRRARQDEWNNALRIFELTLGHAAALVRAGREQEAVERLRWVQPMAEQGAAFQREESSGSSQSFVALAYHASALLADTEREAGEVEAALEDYDAAEEMLGYLDEEGVTTTPVVGLRPERLYANRAIAELAAGRVEDAEESIQQALDVDPMNPAFLMTAGFVADRADDREDAVDRNRAALATDPGAFPAANDLGVQLARAGRHDEALGALRQAVAAEPSYALGWFNLAVVHASLGPGHLLASQGALARATELDPDLAERRQTPTIDARIYRTGLDLSKPLPPEWSFADLDRAAPAASAGLLAVLLMAVGVARAGGRDGGDLAERWSSVATDATARLPLAARLRAPAWTLCAVILLLTVHAARGGRDPWWTVAGYALGVAVLASVALRVRRLVGRTAGEAVPQTTWVPGLLLGVGITAAGSVWAPMPVIEGTARRVAVHAAAPVTLAVLAVALLLEGLWTNVGLARSWGLAALIMAAATLLPVPPHDGARLMGAGRLAGAVLVGVTALVVLGLV